MKIITSILLLLTIHAVAQKDIFEGHLDGNEFSYLKTHLKDNFKVELDSVSLLLIDYIQPKRFCEYNKYDLNPDKSAEWYKTLYLDNNIILPPSSTKILAYYEPEYNQKWNGSAYLYDERAILHYVIRSKKAIKTCECFLALNSNGDIMIKYGEVLPEEIKYFIKKLTINK